MKNGDTFRLWVFIALAVGIFLIAGQSVDAQTARKRPQSVPVPSPTPATTVPFIISRADEFPDTGSEPVLTEKSAPATQATAPEPADATTKTIEELQNRIRTLEGGRESNADAKQKRLSLSLDILTRAEQRAESLRKQLFEMIEKENTIKGRLDGIENDIRPESIERTVAITGSLRPEELRAMRRKNLESERTNLQNLLAEIQRSKSGLEQNVQKADALVDRLRVKLEKEIDAALADDSDENP